MDKTKIKFPKTFNLSEKNIEWILEKAGLKQAAIKQEVSASSVLDDVLTELRENENRGKVLKVLS